MPALFVPHIIIGFGNGLLLPNAIAGAVSVRPQAAGTAAGITGFIQMGLGAAAAQTSGHIIGHAQRDADAAADAAVRDRDRRRGVRAGAAARHEDLGTLIARPRWQFTDAVHPNEGATMLTTVLIVILI